VTTIRVAPRFADHRKYVLSSSSDHRVGAARSADIDEREKQNAHSHWQAIRTGRTEHVKNEQSAHLFMAGSRR
jgi:hypothetical protein